MLRAYWAVKKERKKIIVIIPLLRLRAQFVFYMIRAKDELPKCIFAKISLV